MKVRALKSTPQNTAQHLWVVASLSILDYLVLVFLSIL